MYKMLLLYPVTAQLSNTEDVQYFPWNMHMVLLCFVLFWLYEYHKISDIRHTKLQNLNVSHLVLQLSMPNPFKSGFK